MPTFAEQAAQAGQGIGAFVGGVFNPIIGGTTTTTVSEAPKRSEEDKRNSMIVVVVVIVLVVIIVVGFTISANKSRKKNISPLPKAE